MTGWYLPLDDWLPGPCGAAGVPLTFYDGWPTRARSSGGYDDRGPLGVMWHHTASSPSTTPAGEAAWMTDRSRNENAPTANVVVQRDGSVWVLAAGRTNTNGKGGPWAFSRGQVPADRMNDYAFGIEIANDGVGEPYPAAVVDAAFVVSNAINAAVGNRPDDVCTHQAWAPTRKIDPATAAAVQGPWRPASVTSSGTWSLPDLQAECINRATVAPPFTEDDMTDEQAAQLAHVTAAVDDLTRMVTAVMSKVDATNVNIWGAPPPGEPTKDQSVLGRLRNIQSRI